MGRLAASTCRCQRLTNAGRRAAVGSVAAQTGGFVVVARRESSNEFSCVVVAREILERVFFFIKSWPAGHSPGLLALDLAPLRTRISLPCARLR